MQEEGMSECLVRDLNLPETADRRVVAERQGWEGERGGRGVVVQKLKVCYPILGILSWGWYRWNRHRSTGVDRRRR